MMTATLNIGDQIRPWGALNYGTLGLFCTDKDGVLFFVTCDHVIKTLSTPENGPQKIYFPLESEFSGKIGIFEGQCLVSKNKAIADLALIRATIEVASATTLPAAIPSTNVIQLRKAVAPSKGDEVMLWGARTAAYHSGVVLQTNSTHAWPHQKYGLVKYKKQFSVVLGSQYTPEIGDSGGYVISPDGRLVGMIAALSGTVTEAGNPIIHCVPIKECCELLGVTPVTKSKKELSE